MIELPAAAGVAGCSRAKAKEGPARPVDLVVTTTESGTGEVRELVLLESGSWQFVHRHGVHRPFEFFVALIQQSLVEPTLKRGPFFERQPVRGDVRGGEGQRCGERLPPQFDRLPGDAEDQIEADVGNGWAESRDDGRDVRTAMIARSSNSRI